MNKSLHLAFLATAMAATSTLAVAKPPAPTPVQQSIGTDIGSFSFTGTDADLFYVTLDPGKYVITGTLSASAGSSGSYNITSAKLDSGAFSDTFEQKSGTDSRNKYVEDPYVFTVATTTRLFLDVNTNANNHRNTGGYTGTLTVADFTPAPAIPEPATTALLLAGLGVLGISARRRRA